MNEFPVSKAALFSLVIVCLIYATCCTHSPDGSRAKIHGKGQDSPDGTVDVISRISETPQLSWMVSAFEVAGREDLESLYFPDERRGWVGGKGALYQTSTAGKSWERVKIKLPPRTSVADMFFTASLGWVALQTPAPDTSSYKQNQAELLHSRDGGVNWRSQYTDASTFITRTAFNGQEGWLVGLKYVGPLPFDTSLLVLHTSDQGEHWTDVSEQLNRIAVNEKGYVIGWIKDIISEGPLTATILTTTGQLFRTENGGQIWLRVADKQVQFSNMSACCFGFKEDKRRWIAASQLGEEGVSSLLAFEQPDGAWERRHLGGVSLRDVLYVSDEKLFIAGSILPKDTGVDLNQTEGVILYSSDGGRTWSVIYRNAQVKSIEALAAVDSNQVLAVGGGGLIVNLKSLERRPSGTSSK